MFPEILYAITLSCSLGGLGVAWYVYSHKRKQKPMVCPLHAHCETVVHSEFSRFLGIPLEWLGMFYYGLLFVSYAYFIFTPFTLPVGWFYLLLTLSTLAFLFSLYLTFIQFFVLREYCSWCLMSAGFSAAIFIASMVAMFSVVEPLLTVYRPVIFIVHLVGVCLGAGGAMISDIFFFKFLRDFKISPEENEVLGTLSQIIWLALAILLVSGLALYLPAMDTLNASGKFLTKVAIVGVIIANGAVLNLFIAPKLVQLSFEKSVQQPPHLRRLRRLAFGLGSISMLSWLTVLSVATLPRSTPAHYIIIVYLVLLTGAITTSQFIERKLGK